MTESLAYAGTTVADLLGRVGVLLRPLTTSATLLARPVTGVCIHDGEGVDDALPGELLLAVGVAPTEEAAGPVVDAAAAAGMSGVVLRTRRPVPPALTARAEERGTALLVAPLTPWANLAAILRAAAMSGATASPHRSDRAALGDLFAFAGDVALAVGGAVTVEDPSYRVLAYSSVHGDVDEPRKQTILGRAVPASFVTLLQERGVLNVLRSTDQVVTVEPFPEIGLGPRWAVGIRAAGEFLGSLWVAESGGPLKEGYQAVLREAARTAALHLLHHRSELQTDQTRTQDIGRELLAGGSPADLLATSAGLRLGDLHRVVVLESTEALPSRGRIARAVTTYWGSERRRGLVLEQGPRIYLVLASPGRAEIDGPAGVRIAADVARHAARASGLELLVAVGSSAPTARDIAMSRRQADSTLRVLRHGMVPAPVAAYDDVRSQVTLLGLVDLVRENAELRDGKVMALLDSHRSGVLVDTLAAYLDSFGDTRAASERLGVHPNTFRYRLRRLQEMVGMDLDDPSERIVAALQLRALRAQP